MPQVFLPAQTLGGATWSIPDGRGMQADEWTIPTRPFAWSMPEASANSQQTWMAPVVPPRDSIERDPNRVNQIGLLQSSATWRQQSDQSERERTMVNGGTVSPNLPAANSILRIQFGIILAQLFMLMHKHLGGCLKIV